MFFEKQAAKVSNISEKEEVRQKNIAKSPIFRLL